MKVFRKQVIIKIAVEHEILGKSGAFYKYNDQNIVSREKRQTLFARKSEVMAEIEKKVRAKFHWKVC